MSLDLGLLRVLKYKEQYEKVARFIPMAAISKKTKAIVKDIHKYFEEYPDEEQIDFDVFRNLFFTVWHKTLKDADIDYYNQVLTRMTEDVSDQQRDSMINALIELEFATDVSNLIDTYANDGEIDLVREVSLMTDVAANKMKRAIHVEYAGFEDNTVGEAQEGGLTWPLDIFNQHYRKILAGDQFILAARPGKGKTTMLTFFNAHFASQLPENKIIVWFNNESRRQRCMARQIQSAVRLTDKEMVEAKNDGTLGQLYKDRVGDLNKIRIYDIHGKDVRFLEEILEGIGVDNVGVIVVDMLDNVKFPTFKDVREDQRLEMMYQWLREKGVEYNCPTFPTSQISNEGAGMEYPAEGMLKDSKTGKQGACDGIIMMGHSDDVLKQRQRYFSMPKTKCKLEGMPNMQEEVLFDDDRGIFIHE